MGTQPEPLGCCRSDAREGRPAFVPQGHVQPACRRGGYTGHRVHAQVPSPSEGQGGRAGCPVSPRAVLGRACGAHVAETLEVTVGRG